MSKTKQNSSRYVVIDQARGFAIVLMFIYHFFFDLNEFRFIDTNFYDSPFWNNFRLIIVSLFLTLVGISLILATRKGLNFKRFNQRLLFILIGAAIVSVSSYVTFPRSFIYFGILHFIAVASLLGILFVRFYTANLLLGILIIVTALLFSHPLFNPGWLNWIGLATVKPVTEDYVPLFPWFGVVLIGMFLGKAIFIHGHLSRVTTIQLGNMPGKILSFLGKHSLIAYLLHQPVFFGLLWVISQIIS